MAQPEPNYSPGEAARLAALLARGAYLAQRGKSTAEIERKIDALKDLTRRRIAAEEKIRQARKDQKIQDTAERRMARRWSW